MTIYRIDEARFGDKNTKPSKNSYLEEDGINYLIEINTLEELEELVKEVGKIVLYEGSILIYNYYIE